MNHQPTAETWVDLPAYIDKPLEVYLNGIVQRAGIDYQLVDRALVFPREIAREVKMSKVQWMLVTVGIGSYQKHDSVDVIYERDGRRTVATGLIARE